MYGQCEGCESPGIVGDDGLCTYHRAETGVHPDAWQEWTDDVPSDVIGNL